MDASADVFHRGGFVLVQPARGGHRAGTDALMLAAAVPSNFTGRLVDFGAGAGAVGLAVASRCPAASVLLVEKSAEMAAYAQATLAHPGNRALAGRVSVLQADVSLSGREREQGGLEPHTADFIVMNPPFNDGRDRATSSDLRRAAHVMDDEVFETWLRGAAAIARPRALVALIARPASLGPVLAALGRRFGGAELAAIHARAHLPAIRIVVRARRGARGALTIAPPLVLQEASGAAFTARAEAINAGRGSLFGD